MPIFNQVQSEFPDLEYAAQAIFALGSIAEMHNDFAGAIVYYEQIEKEYPYSNVIVASLVRNANDKLLLRNPQSALLYIQKAESTQRRVLNRFSVEDGELPAAKPYQKQDFNDHFDENILYLKGEALNQVERYDAAITNFQELINTFPKTELLDFANMGLG